VHTPPMADGVRDDDLGVSFGGFSIEGLDDPLAPRHPPEPDDHVEEIDPDPAPMVDLVGHDTGRLPWFGATPWSGSSDQPATRRRVSRAVTALALGTIAAGAAALVTWRLVG